MMGGVQLVARKKGIKRTFLLGRKADISIGVDTQDRRYLSPVSWKRPSIRALVPLAEVEGNDFNLNLPRYIDSTSPEDVQDIEAHLKGGIPNADIDGLAAYWKVFPNVRRELFGPLANAAERPGYSQRYCQPRVEASQVKAAIFGHPEFTAFNQTVTTLFGTWKSRQLPTTHRHPDW